MAPLSSLTWLSAINSGSNEISFVQLVTSVWLGISFGALAVLLVPKRTTCREMGMSPYDLEIELG